VSQYLAGCLLHKNLSEAVQDLLARVLTELKDRPQEEAPAMAQGEVRVPVEEWRPAPGEQVKRTISTHRAEREARYHQVEDFQKQGLTSKEIASRLRESRANRASLAQARSRS
jgi:hypothetical protein